MCVVSASACHREANGADTPSIAWLEAYVRFDGREWETVPEGDSVRSGHG